MPILLSSHTRIFNMAKTSSQMKNMIEDYVNLIKKPLKDTTQEIQEKAPNVEWQYLVGDTLHVTKMNGRDDRINIHVSYKFDETISKQLPVNDSNVRKKFDDMNQFLITNNLNGLELLVENDLIIGFTVKTYIDEELLDRPTFFEKWDKVTFAGKNVLNNFIGLVNPNLAQTNTDSSDSTMYQ